MNGLHMSPRAPKSSVKKRPSTVPAEGERQAMRGYMRQYDQAAVLAYIGLQRGGLQWLGVADRAAGIADDIVLGFTDRVIGHQFKTSRLPGRFSLSTLLMGAAGLLVPLVTAWRQLCASSEGRVIEVRLVTNDHAMANDKLTDDSGSDSASFLLEYTAVPPPTLAQWRASRWRPFIDALEGKSGLDEQDFEQFLGALQIISNREADFGRVHRLRQDEMRLVDQIATLLPRLVTDIRDRDRWSRAELLDELGWSDDSIPRRVHLFPVGAYVQRNEETEMQLRTAIREHQSGYVSLIGPPGAGKSTLLQIALEAESQLYVARYLAYIPNAVQGVGRGEADDFLDDIAAQLRRTGLGGLRAHDDSLAQRREQFEALLAAAGRRFRDDGIRTLIVVDGLDHVPREERPQRSFLCEFPLPAAVPEGVLFLLGTQRVELNDLPPSVREQAATLARQVRVAPLSLDAVARMADLMGLDQDVDRTRLYDNSHGHPLVTRYLIEALRSADPPGRAALLGGHLSFQGDLATVYQAAWRGVVDDDNARLVLDYLARSEAPMPFELLAKKVPESAIERALAAARHLLSDGLHGWEIFHNSFRLFIREQPKLRFGRPDCDFSIKLYTDLAELAREAKPTCPQHWLELRYLARANSHNVVLSLCTPQRFREQFVERRPFSEMRADLRLAAMSAQGDDQHVKLFQILLIFDEMDRRWSAYEEVPEIIDALLAVEDMDGAVALVEQVPSSGYAVVDALIASGQLERARVLFDILDPIQDLLREHHYHGHMRFEEMRDWVRRVIHFRAPDQILNSIDRLVPAARAAHEENEEDKDMALAAALRSEAVLAIVGIQEDADIETVCAQFHLTTTDCASVFLRAGIDAFERGKSGPALICVERAIQYPGFDDTPNRWRRRAALLASRQGARALAESLFGQLLVPTLAELDHVTEPDVPPHLVRAVSEHFELAALLEKHVPEMPRPESELLRPLQLHAEAVGKLLAQSRRTADPTLAIDIARVARTALVYLIRMKPQRGGDFYVFHQVVRGAPALISMLVDAAANSGQDALDTVSGSVEELLVGALVGGEMRDDLLRTATLAIYRHTRDSATAARRLGVVAASVHGQTPAQQISAMANLACAYSETGNRAQAQSLLAQIPQESLGFSLPPKKDSQYAIWRDLFVLANRSSPDGRARRLDIMLRLLAGMTDTEGDASAYRIAGSVIQEAALCDATTAWASLLSLAELGTLGWAHMVDAVLKGLVRRRPDMVPAVVSIWCQLALPYYKAHYYQEYEQGDFIDLAVGCALASEVGTVCDAFLRHIQVEARTEVRVSLLDHLRLAAAKRACPCADIDVALARWRSECPAPARNSSDMRHSDVTSMEALVADIEKEVQEGARAPSYEAGHAFQRLVCTGNYLLAVQLFEKWTGIQNESGARAALIDVAIDAGDSVNARRLLAGYSVTGPEATWTTWFGGKRFRYLRSRLRLEGPAVHAVAYADFVNTVAAEHESVRSLLTEFDDIFPVITAEPDWPAMWECAQDQIMSTREFRLGAGDVVVLPTLMDDAGLLARLLIWAMDIGISDLRWHACVAATELNSAGIGHPVFAELMRLLLSGRDDHPAIGLYLLACQQSTEHMAGLGPQIVTLTNHDDYAVATISRQLARALALPVTPAQTPLPTFYSLDLGEVASFAPEKLYDPHTSAMLVKSSFGWTRAYEDLVRVLAKGAISPTHIRYRAAMLIDAWGSLETFGNPATKELEFRLRQLGMKIAYARPHMVVAARALRHIAGELARAGVLPVSPGILLRHMSFAHSPFVCSQPAIRPAIVMRPADRESRYAAFEESWLPAVDGDVVPITMEGSVVIAEVSEFNVRKTRRLYRSIRVQVPTWAGADDFPAWEIADLLPDRAVWVGQVVPLSSEPAPFLVRTLSLSYWPGMPHIAFCICPEWLQHLNWNVEYGQTTTYEDDYGDAMGHIVWWREGSMIDVDEDASWSEGTYLQLTAAGLLQLEAIAGTLQVRIHAQRTARDDGDKCRRSFATSIHDLPSVR
jgi:hypothetical protein